MALSKTQLLEERLFAQERPSGSIISKILLQIVEERIDAYLRRYWPQNLEVRVLFEFDLTVEERRKIQARYCDKGPNPFTLRFVAKRDGNMLVIVS